MFQIADRLLIAYVRSIRQVMSVSSERRGNSPHHPFGQQPLSGVLPIVWLGNFPLLFEAQLSNMSREAHPIKAAERRQILAPGASPGFFGRYDDEPRRGDRFLANLSPLRRFVLNDTLTTAFGRGCDLSPLRGSNRMRFARLLKLSDSSTQIIAR